jgi:GH18 family chitinase
MMAFTASTIPQINASLDFFNIMTYDLMNRRDNITKHHTGIQLSLESINVYLEKGVPPHKANLGFAFYVKCFKTDPDGGCGANPIGCRTPLMEDPETGADLGQTGGFSWHDSVPPELSASFERALADGRYDSGGGGHYFWDAEENRWWTWDTPEAIAKKFPAVMEEKKLGGVFAWGLGEDGNEWMHLKALTTGWKEYSRGAVEKFGSKSSVTAKESVASDKPTRGREEL